MRGMVSLRDAVRELPDPVAADLLENDDAYLLVIDLPGATADRTSVSTTEETLSVQAKREQSTPPDVEVIQRERPRRLEFELPLPADADADAARASLADGLLEVTIPRGTSGVSIPIEEG